MLHRNDLIARQVHHFVIQESVSVKNGRVVSGAEARPSASLQHRHLVGTLPV
jgi:hypothetical protein